MMRIISELAVTISTRFANRVRMDRLPIFFAAMMAAILAAILVPQPAHAQFAGQPPVRMLNVAATLEAETTVPSAGDSVTLAFVMKPKPKWHGYWENGGDAGVGMKLEWDLPPGVTAENLHYPVPKTLIISGLMNYVYEKPYTLLVDLKIDRSVAAGTSLPVRVRADWLACDDRVCVPEGADLSLNLTIGTGNISSAQQARFDNFRSALPRPIDQQGTYRISGKTIEIAIPFPAAAKISDPYFFPKTGNSQ